MTYYNAPKPAQNFMDKEVVEFDFARYMFPGDYKWFLGYMAAGLYLLSEFPNKPLARYAGNLFLIGALGGAIRYKVLRFQKASDGKGI